MGSGFVFAEAVGFGFQGWPSDASTRTIELQLTRSEERSGRPLVTLPPVLTEAEEAALALRLIEPTIERALAEQAGHAEERAIELLGLIGPVASGRAGGKRPG